MKKYFKATTLVLLITIGILNIACSDDEGENPVDGGGQTSNTGRYAGVLVGSSGWFVVNFTEENASATVQFDGNTYNLSTTTPVIDGNQYSNILFTDGTVSMYFSVDELGLEPAASFSIPGHNVVATIGYAEQNTIHLYEGTSHSENSFDNTFIDYTYNLALNYSDNTYEIIERVIATNGSNEIGETNTYGGTFSISENTIVFEVEGGNLSCTISETTITHYEEGNTIEFELVYESDDEAPNTSPVQAQFVGTFSGDNLNGEFDSGSLSVTVWYFQNAPVQIEGSGYSNFLESEFQFYASVSNDSFEAGSSIGGYTFTGTISGNTMQGTWGNNGTFSAVKQ